MILPNVRTHLYKYRNELHGNHVSVFESRRGDEVAFDEGRISSKGGYTPEIRQNNSIFSSFEPKFLYQKLDPSDQFFFVDIVSIMN